MSTTFSFQARVDIREIGAWTFEQWGDAQVQKYDLHLAALFSAISKNPTSAASRVIKQSASNLRVRHIRSVFPNGRHFALYRITETGIHILRVLHERMDLVAIMNMYLSE